ncbi:MAG TPA: EFR1 family ferrodoxin [Candidatus Faecalicoccus intestinipullorum]|nr:EFR1 family ferrodoxin [Candidatus Faecalicoccus intestinipullorum]
MKKRTYDYRKEQNPLKIFYFTGTGNSLAVAKRLSGELVSIPQVMKERDFVFKDEAIGIIFPLYCLNPPKMVREFLSKAKFNTDYLFAVATYGNLAGASMQ